VRFGDNFETVCRTDALSPSPSPTAIPTPPVKWRQYPGAGATDVVEINILNDTQPVLDEWATSYTIVLEYLFFYRAIGAKKNPQYVLEKVDQRWNVKNNQFYAGTMSIFPKGSSTNVNNTVADWVTKVGFYEIPNDVNMKLDSAINTEAQAWLPF
jgi:hypothetical protein